MSTIIHQTVNKQKPISQFYWITIGYPNKHTDKNLPYHHHNVYNIKKIKIKHININKKPYQKTKNIFQKITTYTTINPYGYWTHNTVPKPYQKTKTPYQMVRCSKVENCYEISKIHIFLQSFYSIKE